MSRPWSKLQKEYYLLVADGLKIQLHCSAYRHGAKNGSEHVPRYWITLDKKTIWDYPRQFTGFEDPCVLAEDLDYESDVPDISRLLREYIDTPKDEILEKAFKGDVWGLTPILKASDKRIGKRRLPELRRATTSKAAHKVIDARTGPEIKKAAEKTAASKKHLAG